VNAAGCGPEPAGAKPTIVLVHGGLADASSWNGVIELLLGQGYTVIAPAGRPPAEPARAASVVSPAEDPGRLPRRPGRRKAASWRDHAACRDVDPELFFPAGNAGPALLQIGQAKLVCAACPVRIPCLEWAMASNQEAGVWGGTSEDERRALRHR
jgi:WhiB family redox-sensing transcriptional regulator